MVLVDSAILSSPKNSGTCNILCSTHLDKWNLWSRSTFINPIESLKKKKSKNEPRGLTKQIWRKNRLWTDPNFVGCKPSCGVHLNWWQTLGMKGLKGLLWMTVGPRRSRSNDHNHLVDGSKVLMVLTPLMPVIDMNWSGPKKQFATSKVVTGFAAKRQRNCFSKLKMKNT